MKSRRQFVKQGAIVTTALLAANPFKALAGISSSFTGTGNTGDNLVFLHTADAEMAARGKTARYINDIKNDSSHTVFVHTGQQPSDHFNFDVQAASLTSSGEYKIIRKGNIKTGIICIAGGETDVIRKVNHLAALLKKEKGCQMVICISHLGYQNRFSTDDMKLAAASEYLDMIIGGDMNNHARKTMVVANKQKKEVIIQSSKGNDLACGKIEFTFDSQGAKKHVHVATRLNKHALAATA